MPKDQKKWPSTIRKALHDLPKEPGVYSFFDEEGELLYVGKANNLRNRVKSYFQDSSNHPPRTSKLVKKIYRIEWTVVRNEVEALVLEANLIHAEKPPFNVLLRDDKQFLYLRISNEPFARVEFCRTRKKDGSIYFGPFAKAGHIRKTLDFLREVLRFRTCKVGISAKGRTTSNPENRKIPCLDHQINRCTAPCDNRISLSEYQQEIAELIDFLRGKTSSVKKRMKEEMIAAAEKREFERAARFRDLLSSVETVDAKQAASVPEYFSADVIGMAAGVSKSFFHVFYVRNGKILRSENFDMESSETEEETLLIFLRDHFKLASEVPPMILVSKIFPASEQATWEQFAREISGKATEIRCPQRGNKRTLLELAEKNANLQAVNSRASFEKTEVIDRLQQALDLPNLPDRIECYDISHLSGTHPVGSRVVFIDGKPAKAEYRKYRMRSLPKGKIDDFAAMAELLGRRLKRLERGVQLLEMEEVDDPEKLKEIDQTLAEAGLLTGKEAEKQYSFRDITTDKTVGYARVRRWGKMAEVGGVIVLPDFRSGGMGTEIIKTVILNSEEKIMRAFIRKERLRWKVALKSIGFVEEKKPPKALQAKIDQRIKDENVEMIVMKVSPREMQKASQKFPDLLVIDGGKGQLSAVVKVLRKLNLFRKIPVCALAKRNEEIFLPDKSEPLPISKDAPENLLLQQIRDEAHRVAVTFNQQQRKVAETVSSLDEIAGIGEITRKLLLKRFGSAQAVFSAADEKLLEVINRKTLDAIRAFSE